MVGPGDGRCWKWCIRLNASGAHPPLPQIDPNRTISAGKVEIGAFRTYPEVCNHRAVQPFISPLTRAPSDRQGYTPPSAQSSEHQSIPLEKIEDFGVHANAYYPLKVSVFRSALDAQLLESLWNKYWVNTLSQSPLVTVGWRRRDQVRAQWLRG